MKHVHKLWVHSKKGSGRFKVLRNVHHNPTKEDLQWAETNYAAARFKGLKVERDGDPGVKYRCRKYIPRIGDTVPGLRRTFASLWADENKFFAEGAEKKKIKSLIALAADYLENTLGNEPKVGQLIKKKVTEETTSGVRKKFGML